MNGIKVYENKEFGNIRVIEKDGETWFVGKDVAGALGYSNVSKAVHTHVDDEDKQFMMIDTADAQNGNLPVGKSKTALINESGLYSLIMSSRLPEAKRFKRWVTAEVLPSIRKTGSYKVKEKAERVNVMLMNAKTRMSSQLLRIAGSDTLSEEHKNILIAKAVEVIADEPLIPLSGSVPKIYSAKDIGEMFGISANMVGRLANSNGLKVSRYGEYRRSISEYSDKEVDTWVYFDNVLPAFSEILKDKKN